MDEKTQAEITITLKSIGETLKEQQKDIKVALIDIARTQHDIVRILEELKENKTEHRLLWSKYDELENKQITRDTECKANHKEENDISERILSLEQKINLLTNRWTLGILIVVIGYDIIYSIINKTPLWEMLLKFLGLG